MSSGRGGSGSDRSRTPSAWRMTGFVVPAAILSFSGILRAAEGSPAVPDQARQTVLRALATQSAYSVEIPMVVRDSVNTPDTVRVLDPTNLVQLTLRTAVDLVNNTSRNGVIATYQFSYTCVAPACSPQGGFYRTPVLQTTLSGLGVFHQDDFVHYLASLNLLQPGADQGAIGTLLVTFSNLGSANGWEVSAIGTTYGPSFDWIQGFSGFAYEGSLFYESADSTLIGFARNAIASQGAGMFESDVGIRNTDIRGTNQNVTVDLSFYDTATGTRVGNIVTLADLKPGELRQVKDVWASAGIGPDVSSVIVFADARNGSLSSATYEGFVLMGDILRSPRFLTMHCADLNGCGS